MTTSDTIRIDEELLDLAVEKKIRPLADAGVFDDPSDEGYHHMKVLPAAQPCLTQEAIQADPCENLIKAVMASSNLLFTQEKIWARQFARRCNADECRRHLLDLLYGPGEVLGRIQSFQNWAPLVSVPGTDEKQGFAYTVISYLLAMVEPKQYAFCKPRVYKAAVAALLGKDSIARDKAERIVHASALYAELLRLFRDKYRLPFDDLLHVHAALYRLIPENNPDSPNWTNLRTVGPTPPPAEPPSAPPSGGETGVIESDRIGSLLLQRKNVILYGPPGTGKTFKAFDLARIWRQSQGETTVGQVTFHPSYAYEDFIEGFRPADKGGFVCRDGVFVDFCAKAKNDPAKQYLLIIDEINRGDVARLFGELITLIEPDKRYVEAARKLPYSKQDFWVPPNLHLLGTMNTADRSISLMDIAIRRRFSFVEFPPDTDVFCGKYLREIGGVSLADLLVGINARLRAAGVDRDRAIGHSYFLVPVGAISPLNVLWARMQYDVFPLVEEYCYADRSMIRRILGDLVDERGELDAELEEDEPALVAALTALAAPG